MLVTLTDFFVFLGQTPPGHSVLSFLQNSCISLTGNLLRISHLCSGQMLVCSCLVSTWFRHQGTLISEYPLLNFPPRACVAREGFILYMFGLTSNFTPEAMWVWGFPCGEVLQLPTQFPRAIQASVRVNGQYR